MAETTPKGEQIQFVSSKTGTHNLDTYLEAAELGNRQLHDLLDDMFDATTGVFKADNFQFRYDNNSANKKLQVRVGQFANSQASWTDITSLFNVKGTFSTSDAYNNFDLVLDSNKDLYLVHGLTNFDYQYSSESNFISNANTTKIVDVSLAQDWAKKTGGIVDSTDYSSKAWAIGGTGVTDTASKGAAKEWAIETSGTVDTASYSSKEYAQGTQAGTGGSSKSWAQDTDQVNGASTNDRSAKSWAQGSSMTGSTLGGSAKDWAQLTGSTVDGTNYSAKYWATGTNVTTVISNISDIQALALKTTELGLLGTTAVVGNLGELGTSTVVGHMANLNATNVISHIGTVAGQISPTNNISTVAGANSNITALTQTGVISHIGTVAGQISPTNNIQTVAGLSTEIASVAGISSEIQTVHTNIAKVQTAADDLLEATSEIDVVASNITSVDAVGTNIGNVNSVGTNIANVNLVGTNIANVNSFSDIYRVSSSAPTSSLDAGDLYFDTNTNKLNVYDGSNWLSTAEAASRALTSHTVTSAGTQTISVTYTVGLIDVYLNGLHLAPADYTASNGSSVVITGCSVNDIIDIVALSAFNAANYGTAASKNTGIGTDNVPTFAANVADNDFLKIDGTTVEGRSVAEVRVEIVDEHINTSGASSNQFLKWNGSDYVWDTVDTSTLMPKSGGTFTGAIDMGSNNITTTGKMLYSNVYSQTSDLPSASTYHGMFAHVHGTGKGYFAHNNAWVELANNSQLADYLPLTGGTLTGDISGTNATLSGYLRGPSSFTIDPAVHGANSGTVVIKGDLQVEGTTTTVDSTTVNIADNLITLASGNTGNRFQADASGIEVKMTTEDNWFIKLVAEQNRWNISNDTQVTGNLYVIENSGGNGGDIALPVGTKNLYFNGNTGAYLRGYTSGTAANNTLKLNVNNQDNITLDGSQNSTFHGLLKSNAGIQVVQGDITAPVASIYHDSSNRLRITGGTAGYLFMDDTNSSSHLTINSSGNATFATSVSSPIFYTGVGSQAFMPDGNDLKLVSQSNELHAYFYNNGAAKLYHDNSVFLESANTSVTINKPDDQDDAYIYFGQNSRARLHSVDGSFLSITNSGSSGNDTFINAHVDSYTYLYHNGNATARTTNDGFQIFSASNNDDGTLYIGDNGNARMQNDEDTSTHLRNGANDSFIWSNNNTYTYIYYDGSWKLRTESNGVRLNNVTLYGIGSHNLQLSSNNAQNMVMYAAGTGSNGLLLLDSAGNYPTQLYGDANAYGFLASAWGNWDIKKVRGGAMTLNGSETVVTSANIGTYAGGGQWEPVTSITASFGSGSSSHVFSVNAGTLYKFVFRLYAKTSGAYLRAAIMYNGESSYMNYPSGSAFSCLSRQAHRLYYSHNFSGAYAWESTGAKLHNYEDMPEEDGGQGYYQGECWFNKPNDSNLNALNCFKSRIWGDLHGGSNSNQYYFDATFDDAINANASGTGSLQYFKFFSSNGSHMGGFIKQFKLTGT